MDIFILAGQSNMAGRGGVYGHGTNKTFDASEIPWPSDPMIQAYTVTKGWKYSWQIARDPLHDTRLDPG